MMFLIFISVDPLLLLLFFFFFFLQKWENKVFAKVIELMVFLFLAGARMSVL